MAIITFGSAAGEQQGGTGSGRVSLYDQAGNLLTKADAAANTDGTTQGLPMMGVDHDTIRMLEVSRSGRLETPNRRMLLAEPCEGATLNSQRWATTATTQTASQSATTGITLNASSSTAINTGVAVTSRILFLRIATQPLHWRARIRSTAVANQEGMAGLFFQATLSGVATVTAADSGHFWKWGTDGTLKPSYVFNGAEVSLGTDVAGSLASANYYDFHIVVDDDRATFQVFNSATGLLISRQIIKLAVTAQRQHAATHLYVYNRIRNGGSIPASGGQLLINDLEVCTLETNHNYPWTSQLSELGLTTSYSPTAFTQLAQHANSAAPASAVLSNTAAGYATLGGLFQFAALVGANTDYNLFGITIPTPYTLKITGIHISAWNTGAANAVTPATLMHWALGLNGASVNLSTGGHIRRTIGGHSIPINAAIGATCDKELDVTFDEPLICYPGTSLSIILRVIAGAATVSQVIQGCVDMRGVFE